MSRRVWRGLQNRAAFASAEWCATTSETSSIPSSSTWANKRSRTSLARYGSMGCARKPSPVCRPLARQPLHQSLSPPSPVERSYLHNLHVFPREKDEFLKKDRYPSKLSI